MLFEKEHITDRGLSQIVLQKWCIFFRIGGATLETSDWADHEGTTFYAWEWKSLFLKCNGYALLYNILYQILVFKCHLRCMLLFSKEQGPTPVEKKKKGKRKAESYEEGMESDLSMLNSACPSTEESTESLDSQVP